jgi:hypothetical protein
MYISRGPSQVRIWKEVDPVSRQITAYHAEWLRSVDNPYFLDGRPHPSAMAPHSWGGFSTAAFEGEMLKITTTHLKEDYYRRNGVPSSDEATLTQYWIRRGDYLTWLTIAYDPLYLTEPMIRSSEYRLALNQQIPPYPCTVVEEIDRRAPEYLSESERFTDLELSLSCVDGGAQRDSVIAALRGDSALHFDRDGDVLAVTELGCDIDRLFEQRELSFGII